VRAADELGCKQGREPRDDRNGGCFRGM